MEPKSKIWKFNVAPVVTMPAGAQILSVQTQDGVPTLWAKVDPDAPREERRIIRVMTGGEVTVECGRFLGTVQVPSGLVFHYFEDEGN